MTFDGATFHDEGGVGVVFQAPLASCPTSTKCFLAVDEGSVGTIVTLS
jgi:hypothetical protein